VAISEDKALKQKVLSLIKQRYCEDKGIKDPTTVNLAFCQVQRSTGDPIFYATVTGKTSEQYIYRRVDLSGLSAHRALDIPSEYRSTLQATPSKSFIADWVFRFTGHRLLPEDIQTMALDKGLITVVIAPDSMRFKNSFQLIRL
jgi:hypothetical protein